MKKHLWPILEGLIIAAPFIIGWWLIRTVVSWGDDIWNKILFVPLFSREFPIAGFLLCLTVLYLIGTARKTRIGQWIQVSVLGNIPILGKFFKISSGNTSSILQADIGYVSMQINGIYKPGRITSFQKIKDGSYVVFVVFIMLPLPATAHVRGTDMILAVKKEIAGITVYAGYSWDTAVQMEIGGTNLEAGVLQDGVWITFEEFLRSQNFLNEKR